MANVGEFKPNEQEIGELEKEAIEKTNTAIGAIENALTTWDHIKIHPKEVDLRLRRIREFYSAITRWEKQMLKVIGSSAQLQNRIELLREFSDICHYYER